MSRLDIMFVNYKTRMYEMPKGRKLVDLTGEKFGRLTVIERDASSKRVKWICRCDCGVEKSIYYSNLMIAYSCGCYNRENHTKHGATHTTEYLTWNGIKRRCLNSHERRYGDYGGRGITICTEWENDFARFLADMGGRPSDLHSIDRIDVNGPYSAENCRWSTRKEQARNTRTNRMVTIDGTTLPLVEWAERYNIKYKAVHYRINELGWDSLDALTIPLYQGNRYKKLITQRPGH